jgi:hypothetical protein
MDKNTKFQTIYQQLLKVYPQNQKSDVQKKAVELEEGEKW